MRIGFLVFDGYSNMVLASAIEPLRAARDYAGPDTFTWRVLSPDGRDVTSSSGLVMRSNGDLTQAAGLDILFVVAGYGARDHARAQSVKALQLASRRVAVLGALDSGAWILAAAGLLDGHRATIHWQDLAQFAEDHLNIEVVSERFVMDRNRLTAGGATTVIDLMLRLIAERGGGALAFDVSSLFVHDARQRTPPGRGARSMSLTTREPNLVKAVSAMRDNIERPLHLAEISAQAAVSQRTLARLFEREFGMSPGRYYQSIRLDAARTLAEETALNASGIAARTGFSSTACLSRAFSTHYGQTLRLSRANRRG